MTLTSTTVLPYVLGLGVSTILLALFGLPRLIRQQRTEKELKRLHPAMMTLTDTPFAKQLNDLLNRRSTAVTQDLWLIGKNEMDLTNIFLGYSALMIAGVLLVVVLVVVTTNMNLLAAIPLSVIGIAVVLPVARLIVISEIRSKAKAARTLMQGSLANVIAVLKLSVVAGRSPTSALNQIYERLSPVMSRDGIRDLDTILQEANTRSLGDALMLFGVKYQVPDMLALGQYISENAQVGTALNDVLATFLNIANQRAHSGHIALIKSRAQRASMIPIPAFLAILVVIGATFVARMGGLSGLSVFFGG